MLILHKNAWFVSCRDPINTVKLTRASYSALCCRSVNHIDTFTSKQTDSASGQSDTLSPLLSHLLAQSVHIKYLQHFTAVLQRIKPQIMLA